MKCMNPPRFVLACAALVTSLALGCVAEAQLPPIPPPPAGVPASLGPVLTSVADGAPLEPPADAVFAAAYDPAIDGDASALSAFRDVLDPHGAWLDDPTYGTVWVPHPAAVGGDFVPYRTAGHWAVAEDGQWMWVSDYDWGYVPFHYGRWVWLPSVGWAWIPGRVYAPAWVLWRTGLDGYDYVGWAPMPPSFIWMNGLAVGITWGLAVPWWFCPSAYLFAPNWHTHVVHDRAVAQRIVTNSRLVGAPTPPHARHARADARPSAAPLRIEGRHLPRSPSFASARIPSDSIPAERIPADARALARRLAPAVVAPTSMRVVGTARPRTVGSPSRPAADAPPRIVRAAPVSPVSPVPGVARWSTAVGGEAARPVARPAPRVVVAAPARPPIASSRAPSAGLAPSPRPAIRIPSAARPSVGGSSFGGGRGGGSSLGGWRSPSGGSSFGGGRTPSSGRSFGGGRR